MIKTILILLLVTTFRVQALDLFKAEYTVFKDGKQIGNSSIELSKDEQFYRITDQTKGTHGMASFLGFKRSEETLFSESDGKFIPDSYHMKQKVAFNKRHSDYQVDAETQMIYGSHKGDAWQIKTPAMFLTPNLVSLRLFQDICAGKTADLTYRVLKAEKVVDYHFKITSQNDGIIEVDKIHSKPSRVTTTWLDTKQQCLPIKVYHLEEGEDVLETKLIKVSFNSSQTQPEKTL
ncbi:hypothetical protein MNBD_GAMMA01-1978 [hydrothermal vent metagenome]|uniref:DUF3108 domain-containing protein n=1 Tax=hydrothermal vent metagenome TaxID=652676 RepID=A0A3B0W3W8_9ZZZZ